MYNILISSEEKMLPPLFIFFDKQYTPESYNFFLFDGRDLWRRLWGLVQEAIFVRFDEWLYDAYAAKGSNDPYDFFLNVCMLHILIVWYSFVWFSFNFVSFKPIYINSNGGPPSYVPQLL
jgi:hypothetical protein